MSDRVRIGNADTNYEALVNSDGTLKVSPAALDADTDSIAIRNAVGAVTTVHNAISGSVALGSCAEVDCKGLSGLLLTVTLSAANSWTFAVYGANASGGTYGVVNENNTGTRAPMSITQATADTQVYSFFGIPRFIKIVPTENADGATATVKVQPFKM